VIREPLEEGTVTHMPEMWKKGARAGASSFGIEKKRKTQELRRPGKRGGGKKKRRCKIDQRLALELDTMKKHLSRVRDEKN